MQSFFELREATLWAKRLERERSSALVEELIIGSEVGRGIRKCKEVFQPPPMS